MKAREFWIIEPIDSDGNTDSQGQYYVFQHRPFPGDMWMPSIHCREVLEPDPRDELLREAKEIITAYTRCISDAQPLAFGWLAKFKDMGE